jgi:competence protein ComGC
MLQFSGLQGACLLALLVLSLLLLGVLLPAWLLSLGWNLWLTSALAWPNLSLVQGLLLWLIVLVLIALVVHPFVKVAMVVADDTTAEALEHLFKQHQQGLLSDDDLATQLDALKATATTHADDDETPSPPHDTNDTPTDDTKRYGKHWHEWRQRRK